MMKNIITNIFAKLALVAGLTIVFSGIVWAGEGDTHDFAQTLQQLLNNNASISSIEIAAQSYPVKKVTVSYRYNKTLTNAVTVSVSVGGTSWGSQNVVGTGNNYSTLEFSGDAITGAITLSFTNNTGSGTGHGTFYVNNVTLTEGASSSGDDPTPTTTYTLEYNANGGTGTMTDTNSPYTAGATVTVLDNEFTRSGYTFSKWNTAANGTGPEYDEGDEFTINANTTLYAQWTEDTDVSSATLTASNLELTGSYTSNTSKTVDGITYIFTNLMKNSSNIQAKESTGTIKNTTAFPGDITSVAITHSGTARATTINGSADGTNWTQVATGSGTINADFSGKGYKYFQITRGSNAAYWTKIEITYSTGSSSLSTSDLTITNASTDLAFDLYNNSTAQVINYTTSSTGAITITPATPTDYFSYVHDATAKTITVTPIAVTPSAQTITISQEADDDYYAGTASFTVSVTNSDPNVPGSVNMPYTVAQARAAIDAGTGINDVYATGIVSKIVTAYNSQYGNISYNISSDGLTTSDQLQAYRGKSYNGNSFTSADDIQVGDIVVVYGNLKKYNSTYEFDQNNQLVSLVRKPATPTFSPAAGAVMEGTEVTISTTTDGATIYYTTDGNEPTTSSTEYTEPITVSAAMTIKAIAVKDAVSSDVATAAYTIADPVATPTFSPAAGIYTSVQNVEISCETEGATIYYTTNGDTPTTSSTPYSGAIYVNETMTIKAIAVKEGMANSAVVEAAYTINIPSIVFDEATNPFNVEYSASSANIHFNASHTIGDLILVLCDSEGNATTYDWFSASISGENVAASWQANADTENSRTAYFKLTADNAVSAIFAVVQAKLVVDYATLPFEWNGGTAAGLNARTGVTVEGAGSDYADSNAPYRIKFDGVGDYILVKTDSRPGKVTIAVKMLGGGNTSKIKVQESADGNTFTDVEELTISGALNTVLNLETTNDFAATTRFVKIIKSVHGSNIGIGPISITAYVAPSTDPAISAEDVNIGCNDTEGSISFTISNPVNGGVVTASKEADWLTLDTIDGGSVPFTCTANTGDVRSATVTLTYSYNTDQTVTKDVTVTQAAYVAPPVPTNWELTTLAELTEDDVFIIVGDNGSGLYALANDNGTSNAPSAVEMNGSVPNYVKWNISGNSTDGYVFYPNGTTDEWLYCTNTNNGVRVGTNTNNRFVEDSDNNDYLYNTATSRWIGVYNSTDWRCYTLTNSGDFPNNIKNQSFTFYKKVVPDGVASSITLNCSANGGRYWATFYNGKAQYVIPDDTPAKAFTMNGDHELYLLGSNGHIIPEDSAVIIISDVPQVTLIQNNKGSASVSDTNILVGSDTAVENNGKQYVLGIKDGVLKFYLLGSIEVPAGKAYYVNE